MRHDFLASVGRAFRRTALPLIAYYGVTLALPLANGAARSGAAFVQHAVVVIAVPLIAIVLVCAVHTVVRVGMGSGRARLRESSH